MKEMIKVTNMKNLIQELKNGIEMLEDTINETDDLEQLEADGNIIKERAKRLVDLIELLTDDSND